MKTLGSAHVKRGGISSVKTVGSARVKSAMVTTKWREPYDWSPVLAVLVEPGPESKNERMPNPLLDLREAVSKE